MRHVGGVAGDGDEGRGEVHRFVGLIGGSEETTLKWSRDFAALRQRQARAVTAHVGPRKHVRQHLARARQVRNLVCSRAGSTNMPLSTL